MGDFLAQLAHHFFADNFSGHEPQATVRQLVLVIPEVPFRETLHQGFFQLQQILFFQGRHRDHRLEGITLTQGLNVRQQLSLVLKAIHLVDNQQNRHVRVSR